MLKRMVSTVLLALVLAGTAAAQTPATVGPERGPAQSPISFTPVKNTRPVSSASFLKSRDIVGAVALQASSVHAVEFQDNRPWGEPGKRTVELARFDSVPVHAPDGWHSETVPLSLAFDADTGAFVCAFTDPDSVWVRSPLDSGAIEARAADAGWKAGPCHGAPTSTLVEVLEAAWKRFGVDPGKAGQVIIRPRFMTNAFPVTNDAKHTPLYPPTNAWIVEMLGTVVLDKDDPHGHRTLTVLVAQFRDGDLESLPSMILP